MKWLVQTFTWWNEQSLGTRVHTWRHGERVGEDQFGNVYYRWRDGKIDPALGFNRRWVIFNGVAEGSKVPPGWYGWLHHMTDELPSETDYKPREWERPYVPNQTGTPNAWRPQGSTLSVGERPQATGDYQAWSPEA
jgi:NADH:ubiquinone oxidoreductase subunit